MVSSAELPRAQDMAALQTAAQRIGDAAVRLAERREIADAGEAAAAALEAAVRLHASVPAVYARAAGRCLAALAKEGEEALTTAMGFEVRRLHGYPKSSGPCCTLRT